MGIGQRLYRSQVEAALATTGATAILGLHIGLPESNGRGRASDDESVPGSRPDGYFSLQPANLHVVPS
jgi:hypothetical protein